MSAIASFYLLDRQRLPAVVRAGLHPGDAGGSETSVYAALREYGRELDDLYDWSGYCLMHVFTYLADVGIPLDRSEYEAEAQAINRSYDLTFLITPAHKAYLSQLEPERHDEQVLRQHFERYGFGFGEAGTAAMDGLAVLHQHVGSLTEKDILVVHIG